MSGVEIRKIAEIKGKIITVPFVENFMHLYEDVGYVRQLLRLCLSDDLFFPCQAKENKSNINYENRIAGDFNIEFLYVKEKVIW